MRRRLSLFVLCTFANTLLAQHITHHFHNVSMTEALQYIQSQTRRYDINFIANELEDFRVTTDVKNKSVSDAILQVVGLYPIRVVRNDERKIYVECTHKTNRHLTGRLVDESNNPVAFANIALLSPTDSILLGGGVSNENGDFVIPMSVLPCSPVSPLSATRPSIACVVLSISAPSACRLRHIPSRGSL